MIIFVIGKPVNQKTDVIFAPDRLGTYTRKAVSIGIIRCQPLKKGGFKYGYVRGKGFEPLKIP